MKIQKKYARFFLLVGLFLITTNLLAAADPNFYVYLALGQSNMEGQGAIEAQDRTVDSRFQFMSAINCPSLGRTMSTWSTATPPTCRCATGLNPTDYFGRTMVANLPTNIRVGVINVAIAGCKIELFDTITYKAYVASSASWLQNIVAEYGGNPYARLVQVAKEAQKTGVIKGILLHQGESNSGEATWPAKVKVIYDRLMNDLKLNPDSVPLLAGEVVNADQGGICSGHNSVIAKLPSVIKNSYVISSAGCTDASDNLHFNSAGYREMGKRYATKMLSLMGITPAQPPGGNEYHWFEAERFVTATAGTNPASEAPFAMVIEAPMSTHEFMAS